MRVSSPIISVLLLLATSSSAATMDDCIDRLAARREALSHGMLDVLYLQFAVDDAQLEVFTKAFARVPAGWVSSEEARRLVDDCAGAGIVPVMTLKGRIILGVSGYQSEWRTPEDYPRRLVPTPTAAVGEAPEDFRDLPKTVRISVTRERVVIIENEKSVVLLPDESGLSYPRVTDVDVSLHDWLEVRRKGSAPGQIIRAVENGSRFTIRFEDVDNPDAGVGYTFDSTLLFAPVEMLGVGRAGKEQVDERTWLRARYKSDPAGPFHAVCASWISQRGAGDGLWILRVFLVERWDISAQPLILKEIPWPPSYTLLDTRYGGTPLLKRVAPATNPATTASSPHAE